MAVVTGNIVMYDMRTTWKGVAAEAITAGWSVHLKIADGLIYACITGENDVCHGWALTTVAAGEKLTVVTTCRMRTDQTERPGYRAGVGNEGTGSAPSTIASHMAVGMVVGWAVEDDLLWLTVPVQTKEI